VRHLGAVVAFYREKIPAGELAEIMDDCRARGLSCHNALLTVWGGGNSVRRSVTRIAPGRPAHGWQGAGVARLCGPRPVRLPGFLRAVCQQNVYRDVLRPGDHGGHRRSAGVRSRKVHPLRGVYLELRRPVERGPGTQQYRLQRGGRGIALDGELGSISNNQVGVLRVRSFGRQSRLHPCGDAIKETAVQSQERFHNQLSHVLRLLYGPTSGELLTACRTFS